MAPRLAAREHSNYEHLSDERDRDDAAHMRKVLEPVPLSGVELEVFVHLMQSLHDVNSLVRRRQLKCRRNVRPGCWVLHKTCLQIVTIYFNLDAIFSRSDESDFQGRMQSPAESNPVSTLKFLQSVWCLRIRHLNSEMTKAQRFGDLTIMSNPVLGHFSEEVMIDVSDGKIGRASCRERV